jgi:hypothetical protein
MRIRRHLPALIIVLLALSGALAQAQTTVAAGDVLYRLDAKSSLEEGCFAPCLCPVLNTDRLIGTFRLVPGPPDPWYRVYLVRDVNWFVPTLGYWVTGSGMYQVGGDFALTQELSLDLKVGDRDVAHYDSGLVPGGADFPAITLTVSMNNMVCHDTVFHVAATPVLPVEVTPYALFGSQYEEGCFGPCDCATIAKPLQGRFGLLRIAGDGSASDYAVVNVDWSVRDTYMTPISGAVPVTGVGLYQLDATTRSQRLRLSLLEDGASAPARFDSGTVTWNGNLKRIDVDAAEDGFACYDHVYSIHARRRSPATATFQVIRPEPIDPGVTPDGAPAPGTPVP